MARRLIYLNTDTRKVDRIRSATLDIQRDGESFAFRVRKKLQARHSDIRVVTNGMDNPRLRGLVVAAFLAQDVSKEDLRLQFPQYKIKPFSAGAEPWPV